MPVYWGSSGSPVLLFSDGMFFDRNSHSGILGGRIKLLGVNCATMISTVTGKVVPVPVPTVVEDEAPTDDTANEQQRNVAQRFALEAKMSVPNNIGVIIHASRLKEIEEMFGNMLRNPLNGKLEQR